MRRLSARTWARMQPLVTLYFVGVLTAVAELFVEPGIGMVTVAILVSAIPLSIVLLLVAPRGPQPMFSAEELEAYPAWGVVFVLIGLVWLQEVDGTARYWGAGLAGMGVLLLLVGFAARRWMRRG